MRSRPFFASSAVRSERVTCLPAAALTWAMPCPIRPAPMTKTRSMLIGPLAYQPVAGSGLEQALRGGDRVEPMIGDIPHDGVPIRMALRASSGIVRDRAQKLVASPDARLVGRAGALAIGVD